VPEPANNALAGHGNRIPEHLSNHLKLISVRLKLKNPTRKNLGLFLPNMPFDLKAMLSKLISGKVLNVKRHDVPLCFGKENDRKKKL
jgi:hypothetical protein